MELVFLGSGGGRWTTLLQRLQTGGFRLHSRNNIHIDPGPGALVAMKKMNISPIKTDAVVVTHCHPDHYNDAEILIEAMTKGMTLKKGILAGSESTLIGIDNLGPAISAYHQQKVGKKIVMKPRESFDIGGCRVECLPTKHSDPTTVGLKFLTKDNGTIVYTSDTQYFEGISNYYKNANVIIFNVIRPRNERIAWHLCIDDVIKICKEAKPELAIIQHFGLKMIDIADNEARRAQKETGINTIAAKDEMKLKI